MSILSYDYYNFSAASNSSNGNAAAAYSLNGARANDSAAIGSPSSLTSLSKPNGSSPAGRQSSAAANTSSSSSSSSSLVALNSPQTSNSTSQTNNNNGGGSSARSTSSNNLLQQLEYNHAFTTAASTTANSNTSSASGALVNYHAAGQLSHQLNSNQSPHSHSTNLSTAGHTSIHNAHHHSTSNNSIFSNSHAHHHHSNSHHHHSNNTNSNLVHYNNDLPDTKEGLDELCPVCGDKVSGYHYGLLTCESCKGFFKRTVQNKKVYNCVAERQCHIDKSQRKRCPYCRFQKCLSVGMKLEAVRADRMRGGRNKFGPMYKRDRARRMQLMRQRQQSIVLNSSLNSNASNSANNSISISNSSTATAIAAVCASNLGSLAGQMGNNEPFSLLNPGILYSTDGIKQELIQIPHLSSSTSSPDSSPSPLSNVLNSAAGTGTGNLSTNSNHQAFGSVAATHPELAKWVNGNMGGVAGSAPSLVGFNSAGSSGVRSLTVGLANSSLTGGSGNGLKQSGGSSFGFIENRNSSSSALAPSFLASAGGSMMLANVAAVVASSSGRNLPFVIHELQLTAPNDKEWQSNLFSLLNEHTYNQCEVDLFDLMCKVIEKNLFAQVDWARNSIFFKELKIDDQMKLLQHSWSHLLVLDHIHQRIHHGLQDDSSLPNGQKFNLVSLALLGEPTAAPDMITLQNTLAELKFDHVDYLCVKFLLLLNPEVRGLLNHTLVQEAQEETQRALHQYTVSYYPQVTNKFTKLMNELPRLRQLTARGEEFLHYKHINGNAPAQTLLMEMLYAKRK